MKHYPEEAGLIRPSMEKHKSKGRRFTLCATMNHRTHSAVVHVCFDLAIVDGYDEQLGAHSLKLHLGVLHSIISYTTRVTQTHVTRYF